MAIEPCFNLKLRQADRVLTSLYNAHLQTLGLKITQFSVLRSLWYLKQCSQQELEKVLLVDQATLTRNLKPLIRDGYIQRQPSSADRRVMLCALSEAGKQLFKQAEVHWKAAQREIEHTIGMKGVKKLMEISNELIEIKGAT